MDKRPLLDNNVSVQDFKDFYWLKEELISFCREEKLPPSGGKIEITERISYYIATGEILKQKKIKKAHPILIGILLSLPKKLL